MSRLAHVRDLGRMSYADALAIQQATLEAVADGAQPSTLLLVEHPPVLTLGANFHAENLLQSIESYEAEGIQVTRTDRGGDVTYHGPGQLVMYPIFDLNPVQLDLHRWLRLLEETVVTGLRSFGLDARRFPPHTGAWIGDRKVAAIGIKVRRRTSMHGIALNCAKIPEFSKIVPCGIQGYGVTSLTEELNREVTVPEAKAPMVSAFEEVMDLTFHPHFEAAKD